jgi:hypothetical protein
MPKAVDLTTQLALSPVIMYSRTSSRTSPWPRLPKLLAVKPGDYGETVAVVRQQASALGLELVSAEGGRRWSCGADELPSYTARARAFEQALQAHGSYAVYSRSAHAEWHAIISGWQLPELPSDIQSLLVKAPDRVALWSAVFNSVNAGLEVSRRALDLLGRRA